MSTAHQPWVISHRPSRSRFLPSPLHAVFREVNGYQTCGQPLAHLHVGEPGFAPPIEVGEAMLRCYADGGAHYGESAGTVVLRELLREKLELENRLPTTLEQIIVTPGSTQALFALFTSLTNPGDRVLLPSPFWPVYIQQCAALSVTPVFYDVTDEGNVDLEQMRRHLEGGAVAMLVNSPANPSGALLSAETLHGILDLSQEFDAPIISDEAYEDFAFSGAHLSIAALEVVRGGKRRVFVTFTFSKAFALTGLRLGYVLAPSAAGAESLLLVQEASVLCPSTLAQAGGVAAMRVRSSAVERARTHLLQARALALPPLLDAGLLAQAPGGGWYALCRVPEQFAQTEDFRTRLLAEHSVGVAPGWPFRLAERTHRPPADRSFRVALCGSLDQLRRGVGAICSFAAGRA